VRKDGTVSYGGTRFEVPYALSGKTVRLVVDPHAQTVVGVEDENGQSIGAATPLDALANANRTRHKPAPATTPTLVQRDGPNLVELAYQQYHDFKED
jgi:putative transposase